MHLMTRMHQPFSLPSKRVCLHKRHSVPPDLSHNENVFGNRHGADRAMPPAGNISQFLYAFFAV